MGKLEQLIKRLKSTPMSVGGLKKLLPVYATFKTFEQLTDHRSKVFGKHDYFQFVVLVFLKFLAVQV